MQNDHIRTLMILKSMSEFGGVWKHQNNPAWTDRCQSSLRVLKLDTLHQDNPTCTDKCESLQSVEARHYTEGGRERCRSVSTAV